LQGTSAAEISVFKRKGLTNGRFRFKLLTQIGYEFSLVLIVNIIQ